MKLPLLVAPFVLALAACATPSPEQMAARTAKRTYCDGAAVDPSGRHAPASHPRLAPSSACDGWARSNRTAIDNRQNLATPHGESMLPSP